MQRINIILVGKLKDKFFNDAKSEYVKRLSAFCKVDFTEISPEDLPHNASKAQIEDALQKESRKVMAKVPKGSKIIAMCIEGKQYDSVKFAKVIENYAIGGDSTITFIIGSSYGLYDSIKNEADLKLSMSEMTFPHRLAGIMLLEQIYRAFTINNNIKYHK